MKGGETRGSLLITLPTCLMRERNNMSDQITQRREERHLDSQGQGHDHMKAGVTEIYNLDIQ